ncbi:unnamed protein product, partial [Ectocarpus sp. 8 AP-2014]
MPAPYGEASDVGRENAGVACHVQPEGGLGSSAEAHLSGRPHVVVLVPCALSANLEQHLGWAKFWPGGGRVWLNNGRLLFVTVSRFSSSGCVCFLQITPIGVGSMRRSIIRNPFFFIVQVE